VNRHKADNPRRRLSALFYCKKELLRSYWWIGKVIADRKEADNHKGLSERN
jgi:hypothetical protein